MVSVYIDVDRCIVDRSACSIDVDHCVVDLSAHSVDVGHFVVKARRIYRWMRAEVVNVDVERIYFYYPRRPSAWPCIRSL